MTKEHDFIIGDVVAIRNTNDTGVITQIGDTTCFVAVFGDIQVTQFMAYDLILKSTNRNIDTHIEEMKECVDMSRWDAENYHSEADSVLCNALRDLGQNELVELWETVNKWYA